MTTMMEERSIDDNMSTGSDISDEPGLDELEAGALARRENEAVSWLRGAAIAILLVAAFTVSVTVYSTTNRAEHSNFHGAFDDASAKILDEFQQGLQRRLGAVDSMSVDLMSYAHSSGSPWPAVTLPDFQMRAASTRHLTFADSVIVLPIVTKERKSLWEEYSVNHQDWLLEGRTNFATQVVARQAREEHGISPHIFNQHGETTGVGPYAPIWQTSPITSDLVSWVNYDVFDMDSFKGGLSTVLSSREAVLAEASNLGSSIVPQLMSPMDTSELISSDPVSPLMYPVFEQRNTANPSIVAVIMSIIPWKTFLGGILPPSARGVTAVIANKCGQIFTFQINGSNVEYIGEGDLHETKFNALGKSASILSNETTANLMDEYHTADFDKEYCSYSLTVFPSTVMQADHITYEPIIYTVVVALIFVFASIVFATYDCLVERRQKVVMNRAMQSTAIVSSLFPATVRDRLFRGTPESDTNQSIVDETPENFEAMVVEPTSTRLKSFLNDGGEISRPNEHAKPIADLFPHCTVLFADISGFTAWSSLRDPAQVFTLLEAVYQAFDRIARRRGVFKVETVGDSYVAVTGLPDVQPDHAVIMGRFARESRIRMNEVTRKLERTLGPDTGDLRMRFGLHSGPVTAGVLRGEKSRFQLFGDTVNTAARMESTGERDRIQISQSTADLLQEAGKGHWIRAREKLVHAKGKGELQTYWLEAANSRASIGSLCSEDSHGLQHQVESNPESKSAIWGKEEEIPEAFSKSKHHRLIEYNVDLLASHLKKVVARRQVLRLAGRRCSQGGFPTSLSHFEVPADDESNVIEEISEVIKLPSFDPRAFKDHVDPESIRLDDAVMDQLKRYVTIIGSMYRNNPFHNFEHASHVTMSVNKLLQRVVTPQLVFRNNSKKGMGLSVDNEASKIASDLHNYTYGITSDPLTQFAVVFAALIHDVDHWGISNNQLIKEGAPMADKYNNKSIAEQNSVDRAWVLLMDMDEYADLQRCIFPTEAEYRRFRQVVVNVVMATDIFDKELNELRRNRWSKVFQEKPIGEGDVDPDDENRKATIVIEHIMQASDVAHTMQHWHVYQKWNRRLFDELYTAWRAGRADSDPTAFWYEGELKFLDGYIIPLAKKLKDCGVFGVASDECLNYARDNRKEWASKGKMIIAELVSNYEMRESEENVVAEPAPDVENVPKKKRFKVQRRRSLWTSGG